MWTKTKDYNIKLLPELSASPLLVSPEFNRKSETNSNGSFDEKDFNIIVSLSYALVPSLNSDSEKVNVLKWVLSPWCNSLSLDDFHKIPLHQVEFFFAGTENGQLFVFPLVPSFTLNSVIELFPNEEWTMRLEKRLKCNLNSNCGARRLLHQHSREEPVSGLHVLSTLVASSSSDGSVALSRFHPICSPITLIPHPHSVRCVKLWEGQPFSSDLSPEEQKKRGEAAAVYLFSGDACGVVRLWRVDVLSKAYVLHHVFLMSPSYLGMHSPLDIASMEDRQKTPIERETTRAVHSMTLDGDARILVGTEENVYCWIINELPWKKEFDVHYHPLQWSHESHDALQGTASTSLSLVKLRAERLVNHHVWIRDHSFVSSSIARWAKVSDLSPVKPRRSVSRWKAKHQSNIAGGLTVGVVSNEVEFFNPPSLSESDFSTSCILNNSLVTVSFEEGELRNDVVLPLSCVEPVVYPLARLSVPIGACFALEMLQEGRRLVTYTSNNCLTIWDWDSEQETFAPLLVAGDDGTPRGLGKNICILRPPDIFLTSGYDDGLVKEWHFYEKSDNLLQCERRFTVSKTSELTKSSDGKVVVTEGKLEECADGISSMVVVPSFGALFLVGVFEHTIQTFRLTKTQGCEVPPNFLYNGFRTIQLRENLSLEEYRGDVHD